MYCSGKWVPTSAPFTEKLLRKPGSQIHLSFPRGRICLRRSSFSLLLVVNMCQLSLKVNQQLPIPPDTLNLCFPLNHIWFDIAESFSIALSLQIQKMRNVPELLCTLFIYSAEYSVILAL